MSAVLLRKRLRQVLLYGPEQEGRGEALRCVVRTVSTCSGVGQGRGGWGQDKGGRAEMPSSSITVETRARET